MVGWGGERKWKVNAELGRLCLSMDCDYHCMHDWVVCVQYAELGRLWLSVDCCYHCMRDWVVCMRDWALDCGYQWTVISIVCVIG